MYYEFDFPEHLRWLSRYHYYDTPDIGGISKVAFGMLSDLNLTGKGLDVGCGTGNFALKLARETELDMIGVEINSSFILNAKQKAKEEELRCSFITNDIHYLLIDGTFSDPFDLVIAFTSGDIFTTPKITANKLNSIVASNGYLIIGWIEGKESAFKNSSLLESCLTDELSYEIVDRYIEDSVFSIKEEKDKTSKMIQHDIEKVSQEDAQILLNWYKNRINSMTHCDGRISTKIIILAQKK